MNSFIEWLDMNGYASWVWSAYALWAVAFAWLVIGTVNGRKRVLSQLQAQQRREAMKSPASAAENNGKTL